MRKLFYGDNLDILREKIEPETVDLVYLDPPFKSDADYNLLFKTDGLDPDAAQWTAFKDTWWWDTAAQLALAEIQELPNPDLVNLVNSLHAALGPSTMMAYLVNMALRLHYIHRSLKSTGSLYIHCDPVASHYLKIILDSIFSPYFFRSEIAWRRTGSHNKAKRWAPIHDTILFYTKGQQYTWNYPKQPYMRGHVEKHFVPDGKGGFRTNYYGNVLTGSGTRNGLSGKPWKGFDPTSWGRHWAIPGAIWEEAEIDPTGLDQHQKLDALYDAGFIKITPGEKYPIYEMTVRPGSGPAAPDLWTFQPYTQGTVFGTEAGIDEDVRWLSPQDQERLGYPTQKPVGLLKRIIQASSNKGDLVLDPFCGCGTTVEAAEHLERQWIGIDISPFAIELVRRQRIEPAFPSLQLGKDYEIDGLPTTLDGAKLMAANDKHAFQIWCVAKAEGLPNEKKGPDGGIDGRIKFIPDGVKAKYAIVSVKGGKLKSDDVRALAAVAKKHEATSDGFGVLITLNEPTAGMRKDAAAAGTKQVGGQHYSLVQIITVAELLDGKKPVLPLKVGTSFKKVQHAVASLQKTLELD